MHCYFLLEKVNNFCILIYSKNINVFENILAITCNNVFINKLVKLCSREHSLLFLLILQRNKACNAM